MSEKHTLRCYGQSNDRKLLLCCSLSGIVEYTSASRMQQVLVPTEQHSGTANLVRGLHRRDLIPEILKSDTAFIKLQFAHPAVATEDTRGHRTLNLTPFNYVMFNNAHIYDVAPVVKSAPHPDDQLALDVQFVEKAAEEIRKLGVATVLTVAGAARAAKLLPTIERCGFVSMHESAIMQVKLASVPGLTSFAGSMSGAPYFVREMLDLEVEDQLGEMTRLALDAFGLDGPFTKQFEGFMRAIPHGPGTCVRHFRALRTSDGRVVGVVSLLLNAGIAYLSMLAVHREMQRKGIGRMLTCIAFKTALDAGYKHGGLISSVAGERLYKSLGMYTVGSAAKFVMFPQRKN